MLAPLPLVGAHLSGPSHPKMPGTLILPIPPYQVRLVERLHLDFVRAGARFDAPAQRRYSEIMEKLAELETEFSQVRGGRGGGGGGTCMGKGALQWQAGEGGGTWGMKGALQRSAGLEGLSLAEYNAIGKILNESHD